MVDLPNGTCVSQCPLANVSVCEPTAALEQKGNLAFVVFNSLGQNGVQMVDIPVYSKDITLLDGNGQEVETIVTNALPARGQYGTDINKNAAGYNLHFRARTPPLGFSKYMLQTKRCTKCTIVDPEVVYRPNSFVNEVEHEVAHSLRSSSERTKEDGEQDHKPDDKEIEIGNEHITVTFKNGKLFKMKNLYRKVEINITQEFLQYTSCAGPTCDGQRDGAYIFRPVHDTPVSVYSTALTLEKFGDLEVRQSFGDGHKAIQRFRVVDAHLEITWTVGPIDQGQEIVSRFQTSIHSAHECYTDSNGLDMQHRKKDYRPSWNFTQTQPVAGNYFPLNSGMFIRDKTTQLTMVVDRAQGGTGVLDVGQMEIMLHRSSLEDDSRGVGEPLFERDDRNRGLVVRGTTALYLGDPSTSAEIWRPLADRFYMSNQIFYLQSSDGDGVSGVVKTSDISIKSQESIAAQQHFDAINVNHRLLAEPLPKGYQFVSVERQGPHMLIRMMLRNVDTAQELESFKAEPLQLKGLFSKELVDEDRHHVIEVSATSNQARIKMDRYRQSFPWSASSNNPAPVEWKYGEFVNFKPGQVRTFLVYSKSETHENGYYDIHKDVNPRVEVADRLIYS